MSAPILKYFEYEHLPAKLQAVGKPFGEMARDFDAMLPDGPEKSAGLQNCWKQRPCQ